MLILKSFSFATIALAVVVSPPLGRYGVATTSMELVDTSRKDPFADDDRNRRLMVSAFYPTGLLKDCQPYTSPYMPPATAAVYDAMYAPLGIPNGTFESLEMAFCKTSTHRTKRQRTYSIVIFSPGLGNSRRVYSAMAQSVASHGFVVFTLDHPYDAAIVEYPDGTLALAANFTTEQQITEDLNVRQHDVSFVIDQLHNPSMRKALFGDVAGTWYLDSILMYGHSLGGATAAAAMLVDSRVVGGINLDGTLFGPVVKEGLGCPFMLFGHEGKNLSTDTSWKTIWPRLKRTKLELSMVGSQHGTFTDFPLLAKAVGLPKSVLEQLTPLLGRLDGKRALEIVVAYTIAFSDFALGVSASPVLHNSHELFPEVELLKEVVRGSCICSPT